ncbi:Thioredoxin Y, chloroplastic [Linum grandiflorum]
MAISSLSASSSVASSFGTSQRHSSKLSSFSSASQLPLQLKPNRLPKSWISAPSRRSRILTKVSAKKQSFANLDELLQNTEKPVLVDFYATWCGPCQLMVPILEEVSSVLTDTVQVVKIDTEKYVSIANQYDIQGLPTFILFKDGKPIDRFEGALPKEKLIQRIQSSLNVKQS